MKNLTKKFIVPIVLSGSILAGCTTYQPVPVDNFSKNKVNTVYSPGKNDETIDLRNGFFAESYKVSDILDLIASLKTGEVILQKTEKDYEPIETETCDTTPSKQWNNLFKKICFDADIEKPYYFISEKEAKTLLDEILGAVQWQDVSGTDQ